MVALLVADLPRSIMFYSHLGIEFPPDAGGRAAVQVPIGGEHQFVLTTRFAKLVPGYEPQPGPARFRTDFGAYMCMVDDPDENVVLVTAA
jgi:hypothetical protein